MIRWFLLLLNILSASEYSIVFIHLGPALPSYAPAALKQARLFNPDCPIYLIASEAALQTFSEALIVKVAAESLVKSGPHETFLRETGESGFWRYVIERFFYLEELMSQYQLKNVFHLENDNMLYADLGKMLPIFQKHYPGMMGVTFDNDERGIGGFMYISEIAPLSKFVSFAASKRENDMALLGFFRKKELKKSMDHLPIIDPSYKERYPLETPSGKKALNGEDYSNHFNDFGSIFDAAALGQYLGGIDPIHANHEPGFINESCVFNPSHLNIMWEKDPLGRNRPIVLFQGHSYPINTLHIHSKNLSLFSSLSSGPMPTIILPPPPEKITFPLNADPIDVVLIGHQEIDTIRSSVQNLGRIFTLSKETLFPFTKESILLELFPHDVYARRRYLSHPRNQLDQIFSQLARLYAPLLIQNISSNVLVIDGTFPKAQLMTEKGDPFFYSKGKESHATRTLGKKLLPAFYRSYVEIDPFALLQRPILEDFFAQFKEEPWKEICHKIDKLYENPFSSVSLYVNFALQRTEQAKLSSFDATTTAVTGRGS